MYPLGVYANFEYTGCFKEFSSCWVKGHTWLVHVNDASSETVFVGLCGPWVFVRHASIKKKGHLFSHGLYTLTTVATFDTFNQVGFLVLSFAFDCWFCSDGIFVTLLKRRRSSCVCVSVCGFLTRELSVSNDTIQLLQESFISRTEFCSFSLSVFLFPSFALMVLNAASSLLQQSAPLLVNQHSPWFICVLYHFILHI